MGLDLWEEAPATTAAGGWEPDAGASTDDAWQPEAATANDEAFTGEFHEENISKHANGAADGGCRNCGEDGHFARDCPNEKVEREFTGDCLSCGLPGHRRAECPTRGPQLCKICREEGHLAVDCEVNRVTIDAEVLSKEDAWTALEAADKEREVEGIRKAMLAYARAFPDVTFFELESTFRDGKLNTYLIGKEQAISDTHTIVDLQGKPDKKYAVSIQFSSKPKRAALASGWPSTPEENLERLADAGFIMDGLVKKCGRCGELGHSTNKCEQPKDESVGKVEITCGNCDGTGHRYRDCPAERKKRGGVKTCRTCGAEDHLSADCPDKIPDVCRNCGEQGHRKAECVNDRVDYCFNCESHGHTRKICPLPLDMSKVKCSDCGELGHFKSTCPSAGIEKDAADDGDGGW